MYFKVKKTFSSGQENVIVMDIRNHLLNRDNTFEIMLNHQNPLFARMDQKDAAFDLLTSSYAIRQPFVTDDFDYLRQNICKISYSIRKSIHLLTIVYHIQYYTTLDEEKCVEKRIDEIISMMKIKEKKNDFLKLKCIYDYIISNVEYDSTYARHSAYQALFEGKAVCDGCAALLYRMLSAVNIPCRIITGAGMREKHAWNIVCLGNWWYNLDVTWDLYCRWKERNLKTYQWFLKGSKNFLNHSADEEYRTPNFYGRYNIAVRDYYE